MSLSWRLECVHHRRRSADLLVIGNVSGRRSVSRVMCPRTAETPPTGLPSPICEPLVPAANAGSQSAAISSSMLLSCGGCGSWCASVCSHVRRPTIPETQVRRSRRRPRRRYRLQERPLRRRNRTLRPLRRPLGSSRRNRRPRPHQRPTQPTPLRSTRLTRTEPTHSVATIPKTLRCLTWCA
jgi:hypothetical protein